MVVAAAAVAADRVGALLRAAVSVGERSLKMPPSPRFELPSRVGCTTRVKMFIACSTVSKLDDGCSCDLGFGRLCETLDNLRLVYKLENVGRRESKSEKLLYILAAHTLRLLA